MIPIRIRRQNGVPTRWFDPFGEFDLFGEFDRLADRLAGGCEGAWVAHRADIWEDGENVYVELEIPGVKSDDVSLSYENNILRIEGEKNAPEQQRNLHLSERRFGKFARAFHLSDVIDPESIDASFKDGILVVKLAKRPESKPKKIEIKVD